MAELIEIRLLIADSLSVIQWLSELSRERNELRGRVGGFEFVMSCLLISSN